MISFFALFIGELNSELSEILSFFLIEIVFMNLLCELHNIISTF